MTPQDRLGWMSKETFMGLSTEEKWGVWFDYTMGERADQKDRCSNCFDIFDQRYEPRHGTWWKTGYLTLMAIAGLTGGFLAQVFGYSPKMPMK